MISAFQGIFLLLERKLRERLFYVLRPSDDVIAAASLTNPSMMIFILICGENEGKLVVVQSPRGCTAMKK